MTSNNSLEADGYAPLLNSSVRWLAFHRNMKAALEYFYE